MEQRCDGQRKRSFSGWLLLFLWLPLAVPAQTRVLTGRTLDGRQQPVPFATVAVPGTHLGTAADAEGHFRLPVPDTLRPTARVVASAVGYLPATALAGSFGTGEQPLVLPARPVSLTEVVIRPGRERVTVGPLHEGKALTSALYDAGNLVGATGRREVGSLLTVDQSVGLQDFNFQVAFNTFREVRVRLRLYRVTQGRPAAELVPEGIPVVVTQKRGWVSVDLREFGLHCAVGQTLAATLHWERDTTTALHRHGLVLAARTGRRLQYLSRAAPAAPWLLTPGSAPVCYFTASAAAPDRPAAEAGPAAPTAALTADESLRPSPLFRLMQAIRFPPRSFRHYGDSTARGRTVPVAGALLRVPTLVLAGQYDIILEAHTCILAAAIPGAELTIFPEASHFVPHERPRVLNARVLAFLGVKQP